MKRRETPIPNIEAEWLVFENDLDRALNRCIIWPASGQAQMDNSLLNYTIIRDFEWDVLSDFISCAASE